MQHLWQYIDLKGEEISSLTIGSTIILLFSITLYPWQLKRKIPIDIRWHHFVEFIWVKPIYSCEESITVIFRVLTVIKISTTQPDLELTSLPLHSSTLWLVPKDSSLVFLLLWGTTTFMGSTGVLQSTHWRSVFSEQNKAFWHFTWKSDMWFLYVNGNCGLLSHQKNNSLSVKTWLVDFICRSICSPPRKKGEGSMDTCRHTAAAFHFLLLLLILPLCLAIPSILRNRNMQPPNKNHVSILTSSQFRGSRWTQTNSRAQGYYETGVISVQRPAYCCWPWVTLKAKFYMLPGKRGGRINSWNFHPLVMKNAW